MINKNIILFLLLVVFSSGCSNEIEHLISGQWQLKTIEENGTITPVDTVFFSFQRGEIFALTVLLNQNEARVSYGYLNKISETELSIQLDSQTIEDDNGIFYRINMDEGDAIRQGWLPENNFQQIFSIIKQNSKVLILFANKKTYSFKKF